MIREVDTFKYPRQFSAPAACIPWRTLSQSNNMRALSKEGTMAVTQTRQLSMTRFTTQLRKAQLARRRGGLVAAVAKADLGDNTVRVALNLYSALQVRGDTAVTRIGRLKSGRVRCLIQVAMRMISALVASKLPAHYLYSLPHCLKRATAPRVQRFARSFTWRLHYCPS